MNARTRTALFRKKQWGLPPPTHGTTGYSMWGCRCEVCTAEWRAYTRAYRRRKRAEGRPVD